MKKYVKPELFYERYELSQHIADCAWEMQYKDKEACKATADKDHWGDWNDTLFTETLECDIDYNAQQDYCYHAGEDGMNVFIS